MVIIGIKFSRGGLDIFKEENQLRGYANSSERSRVVEMESKEGGRQEWLFIQSLLIIRNCTRFWRSSDKYERKGLCSHGT